MSELVAVTGANGFVGRYFVEKIGLQARPISRVLLPHPNSEVIEEINSSTDWDSALDGCNTVVHLAALAHTQPTDINKLEEVNVRGTVRLFEKAVEKGIDRFIYISTIGIHGTSSYSSPFKPSDDEHPNGLYACSKLSAENKLKELARSNSIELVIIRPPLIYGKDAPGNFSSILKLVDKSPALPFGLARNRRDFISIYNFIDLLSYCLYANDVNGKIIIPSDNDTMSIRDFTSELASSINKNIYQIPIPTVFFKFGAKILGKEKIYLQLFGNLEIEFESNNISWLPKYSVRESLSFFKDSLK